jgi:hypothetical protein
MDNQDTDLIHTLVSQIEHPHPVEATVELWSRAENAGFGELMASIKVVGPVMKIYHWHQLKKIKAFMRPIAEIDLKKREAFVRKLHSTHKLNSVGTLILELLDKALGERKSMYLGKIFVAHMTDEIEYKQFVRYAEMINDAYVSDLDFFVNTKLTDIELDTIYPEVQHLLSLGFYIRKMNKFGNSLIEGLTLEYGEDGEAISRCISSK